MTNPAAPKYEIFFLNFDYASNETPSTFNEAVAVAKKACFEAVISRGGEQLATWSPISGLRMIG